VKLTFPSFNAFRNFEDEYLKTDKFSRDVVLRGNVQAFLGGQDQRKICFADDSLDEFLQALMAQMTKDKDDLKYVLKNQKKINGGFVSERELAFSSAEEKNEFAANLDQKGIEQTKSWFKPKEKNLKISKDGIKYLKSLVAQEIEARQAMRAIPQPGQFASAAAASVPNSKQQFTPSDFSDRLKMIKLHMLRQIILDVATTPGQPIPQPIQGMRLSKFDLIVYKLGMLQTQGYEILLTELKYCAMAARAAQNALFKRREDPSHVADFSKVAGFLQNVDPGRREAMVEMLINSFKDNEVGGRSFSKESIKEVEDGLRGALNLMRVRAQSASSPTDKFTSFKSYIVPKLKAAIIKSAEPKYEFEKFDFIWKELSAPDHDHKLQVDFQRCVMAAQEAQSAGFRVRHLPKTPENVPYFGETIKILSSLDKTYRDEMVEMVIKSFNEVGLQSFNKLSIAEVEHGLRTSLLMIEKIAAQSAASASASPSPMPIPSAPPSAASASASAASHMPIPSAPPLSSLLAASSPPPLPKAPPSSKAPPPLPASPPLELQDKKLFSDREDVFKRSLFGLIFSQEAVVDADAKLAGIIQHFEKTKEDDSSKKDWKEIWPDTVKCLSATRKVLAEISRLEPGEASNFPEAAVDLRKVTPGYRAEMVQSISEVFDQCGENIFADVDTKNEVIAGLSKACQLTNAPSPVPGPKGSAAAVSPSSHHLV